MRVHTLSLATLAEALPALRDSDNGITYINGQDDQRFVSYAALYRRALGILHHLQAQGIEPGQQLILFLNNNEQFVDVFWACMLGGIIAVPLAIGSSDEHRRKVFTVFEKLQQPHIYTDAKNLARLRAFAESHGFEATLARLNQHAVRVDSITDLDTPGTPATVAPEDTAFIQFSSGSTGSPKGVVLSHKNLVTNVSAIAEGIATTEEDASLSWMPLTHDMGIIGFHLTPLLVGRPQALMPTELFVRRPLLWLSQVADTGTTILSSPNFGYKHFLNAFQRKPDTPFDLSRVRVVFNGAEAISADLVREFNTAMAPFGLADSAMFPVYGLAEASLAVTFSDLTEAINTLHAKRLSLGLGQTAAVADNAADGTIELVSCGTPVQGSLLQISDAEGKPLADGTVGRVLIAGDNVTRGYYLDDALNTELITDGWLDTGDLGFIHQGDLYIAGRTKDLVIINGHNLYLHDVDELCADVDGIDLGKVAAVGVRSPSAASDELVVFVVHKGDIDAFKPIRHAINTQVTEQTGVAPAQVLPIRAIPKTTSGKVQRYALAESYLAGEFDEAVAALTETATKQDDLTSASALELWLKSIADDVIPDMKVGLDDNIFDIGTSSLKLAQIHERIDEQYPDLLDVTDFFDYPTIREMAEYLSRRLQEEGLA